MSYIQNGEGGNYQCDECGRMSNDPLPPFYDDDHPRDEKWAHLTIRDMGLDLCSICVRTKLPLTAEDALTQVRTNIVERASSKMKITIATIRPYERGVFCNELSMSGAWKCALKAGHGGNHSPYTEEGRVPEGVR